jgi:hypothetical protein
MPGASFPGWPAPPPDAAAPPPRGGYPGDYAPPDGSMPPPVGYPPPDGYPPPVGYPRPAGYAPPGGFPQPPGDPTAPVGGPARPRRRARLITVIALLVVGLIAAGGGAGGLVWVHTRKPTPAQVAAAGQREYAVQWRWLTAGQIFPAKVGYTSSLGTQTSAILVGIAPQASCSAALDAAVARVLNAAGCVTVLRATYADPSGTVLATIGVVVMRSTLAADHVLDNLRADSSTGLLPVSFPGTIADKFTRQTRETVSSQGTSGEYLIFDAGGYADGRKTTSEQSTDGETAASDLPTQLVNALSTSFSASSNPCTLPEVRC